MPELPEVETIARGLRGSLPERRIVGVRLGKTDFIDDPAAIEREIPGTKILDVRRHGKFLLIDLERANGAPRDFALLVHLGMTGQLVMCDSRAPILPHTHVFFALDDGRELRYTDVRRFGRMGIVAKGIQERSLGSLGLDPLEVSEADFIKLLKERRARLKALLLDQTVLRGIGNIYADESLWRARLNPERLGANLSPKELRSLHRAVQAVLNDAIEARGSSIADYVDADGNAGRFQQLHRVYHREGKRCFRCGTVIRRAIVAGRSSHFCPHCQPAPRARRSKRKAGSSAHRQRRLRR